MKKFLYNLDNIEEKDIDEIVTRVKAVIINSNNEIMLGLSHKTYQFPGGHVEYKEKDKVALFRELKEELGIDYHEDEVSDKFALIEHITSNYRDSGKVRKNNIFYYLIKSDKKHNLRETNYDDYEKEGEYKIKYIPISNVENILLNSINDNDINSCIVKEMLQILEVIKEEYIKN